MNNNNWKILNSKKIDIEPQKCLHDICPQCHGKGIKQDGTMCIHMISCTCEKCSPHYL